MKKLIVFVALFLAFCAADALAQNTRDTTYFQGFLTDNKGIPIHQILPGKVSLFDVNDVLVATVFSGNVQVVNGYFSVPLAYHSQDKSILAQLSKAVSAIIEIDGKPFTKVTLGSVLFAKFAQIADSSVRISNSSVTNTHIADSAAIDGKKIFPDFGNQNITTTGSVIGADGKFKTLSAETLNLKDLVADNITANKDLNVSGDITNSTPNSPLLMSDSVRITGDLNVLGNLNVSGRTNLSILNVSESSTFEKDATFKQNVNIDRMLNVAGTSNLRNTVIDGTLNVSGTSTFASTINTDGLGTFNNGITITKGGIVSTGESIFNGTTTVNGGLFVKNGLTALEKVSSGDAQINGTLTITKKITGNDDLTIQGFSTLTKDVHIIDKLYVHKDLTVDGKSNLKGGLGIMGDLDVSGTGTFRDVKVTNSTTLNLLDVTGNANLARTTIRGNVDVLGNVSINPDVDVSNKTTTKVLEVKEQAKITTLDVSENTTLNALIVRGTSNLKGNTTVDGDFTVTTGISKLKNTVVDGTLGVSGQVTAKNKVLISPTMTDPTVYSLYVDGKTYFKEGIIAGDLTLENTLTVNGDTKLKNLDVSGTTALNVLTVGGASTLKATTVDGNFTVLNGISKLKNTIIEGTLDVSGQMTTKGKLLISSTVTDPGLYSLYVDGKTYFKEGIIAGDLTLENTLTVNGNTILKNLNVTEKIITKDLDVSGATRMNTGLITGSMDVSGELNVGGKIAGRGKMILSETNNDPGNYQLYVDGKTYFKEGILAGDLTLDHSLTVTGATTLDSLYVRKGSILHNTKVGGSLVVSDTVSLPNDAIQYYELETSDISKKIRDINFRKADNVKDILGLQPDKTHLHNLAIAIFRYMGTPGTKTYEGDEIKDTDGTVIVNHNTTSTSVIQNLISNFTSTDKTTYINNLFKDVVNIELKDGTTIGGDNLTFLGNKITIGCLEIDCNSGNTTIQNVGGSLTINNPSISNPTFTTPVTLPQNSIINNSTILNSTSTNTTLSGVTTVSGSLDLSKAAVTWPSPLILVNPSIAGATLSGDIDIHTKFKGEIDISECTFTPPISSNWKLTGNDLYPSSSIPDVHVQIGPITTLSAGKRFAVNGASRFEGQVQMRDKLLAEKDIQCNGFLSANGGFNAGRLDVAAGGTVHIFNSELENPMLIGNISGTVEVNNLDFTGILDAEDINCTGNYFIDGDPIILWSKGNGGDIHYSSGNVGIGISPTYKLDVNGLIHTNTGVQSNLNNGGNAGTFSNSGTSSDYALKAIAGDQLEKGLQVTGKSYFDGNVGIGTTTPGQKLDIVGGNGRVQTGYNWLTNSDVRYKKDVSTLENPIFIITNLRGVRFNIKSDSVSGKGQHIGFIAQELEKFIPEVVVTNENGYKSVAYDKVSPFLVEAFKVQQQQIDSLRTRLSFLEELSLHSSLEEIEMNGTKNLIDGQTEIELKKSFENVDVENGLSINLTPRGECNGLFVATIKDGIITIKESGNGKSNAGFYYSIKASKPNPGKSIGMESK